MQDDDDTDRFESIALSAAVQGGRIDWFHFRGRCIPCVRLSGMSVLVGS